MTAYVKMVGDFARVHFGGNEAGQNMVETALIIGTISLVIVGLFMVSGIQSSMGNLAARVACEVGGGNWTLTGSGGVGAGSCTGA